MKKMFNHLLSGFIFALGLSGVWSGKIYAQSSPSISQIVFLHFHATNEWKQEPIAGEGRQCLRTYLQSIPPHSILWKSHPAMSAEEAVAAKRRYLEEQIVVILGENVRHEAHLFSSSVSLLAEWEGMMEGPLEEAEFAGQWIQKNPHNTIAPFLHLFQAHRLRAAYEAAWRSKETGLRQTLAKRYRESLQKARSSPNPLVSCIAEDLEVQPFVYLEGKGRP